MSDYQKLLEMWREEKQKRQTAENELSIIKGIGNNSPEMKKLKEENEKLKKDLTKEKLDREYDNSVHKQEIEDLMKGKFKR